MRGFLVYTPFWNDFSIDNINSQLKHYQNERLTLYHRSYPGYRMVIRILLLLSRRNHSRIIGYSCYSFTIGLDQKSVTIEQDARIRRRIASVNLFFILVLASYWTLGNLVGFAG